MARIFVFADEAGNFDFNLKPGASRHFLIGTVTVPDCTVGDRLLELRRELAWQGVALETAFHATTDPQAIRNEVFDVLKGANMRLDFTIAEKRKTQPHLQDPERFYKMVWFLHFKHVAPRIASSVDEMLVVAASIGTKKRRKAIRFSIGDVVAQSARCSWEVAFWPAESDPCLVAADYCTWLSSGSGKKATSDPTI